jgi:hypothetical protein
MILLPRSASTAEFSATLLRSGGGEEAATSKVYLKGDLRREEVKEGDEGEDDEVGAVMIYRPDKGVIWTLMPDEKMYMEMPLQAGATGAHESVKSLDASAKRENLSKETLNGFECEKRRYIKSNLTRGSITVWYSPKLDYPVKIHIQTGDKDTEMIMEYKDIKPGEIPASRFEVPADYQKMTIPGMPPGMPGGMPAGMPEMPGMGN